MSIPRENRVRKRREFQAIARRSRRSTRGAVSVQVMTKKTGGPKVGFTVSKKVGNAVVRSKVKRQLREAVRSSWAAIQRAGPCDIVVVACLTASESSYQQLLTDFLEALKAAVKVSKGRRR